MGFNEKIKTAIRNYLEIDRNSGLSINIEQLLDFEAEAFKSSIWYRGEPNELQVFYESIDSKSRSSHFWGARPTKGMNIRKIHTGLPALIVDMLTNICVDDLAKITVPSRQTEWDDIDKENSFKKLVAKCVTDTLIIGDGAFKLSYDPEISAYPIIEFFPGDRVDFIYRRGRITEITFKTRKTVKDKCYILKEHYRKDSISYSLEDSQGNELDISDFAEFEAYKNVRNQNNFIPAVQVKFKEDKKHEGRGKSIFSGKYEAFDAYDEAFSQWMLAIRKGQIKTYIPEDLLPKDDNGKVLNGSDFDNDYIQIERGLLEGNSGKIETTQGEIQHEALLSTYCTALDLCLQGVISPSTLGVDVKKLDNAEAQREKEKTTLYTRNKVIDVLCEVIPELVEKTFLFYDSVRKVKTKEDIKATVNFGGYANPSFEAQVETVGKAAQYSIMSVETCVEELYGEDKDESWKKNEVKRIKAERGIIEVSEPALNE